MAEPPKGVYGTPDRLPPFGGFAKVPESLALTKSKILCAPRVTGTEFRVSEAKVSESVKITGCRAQPPAEQALLLCKGAARNVVSGTGTSFRSP